MKLCDIPLNFSWPGSAIQLELEPAGVLYGCFGGPLRTNCNVSSMTINDETILEWNITIPSYHTTQTRSIIGDSMTMAPPILLNLTTLNISRSFPLSSMIFTDNATADLNGTMITCSGQDFGSGVMASASVQIILIGNNHGAVNSTRLDIKTTQFACNHNNNVVCIYTVTPDVNISRHFEANGITITLEWDAKNGVSYVVSVQPEVLVDYTQTNSVRLSLPYEKLYNISIRASLCGRNRTTSSECRYGISDTLNQYYCTVTVHMHTVRCYNPVVSNGNIIISDYGDPPIEGTIITLSCLHGLILTGSNTSTCMGNGDWEPDLKRMQCKSELISIIDYVYRICIVYVQLISLYNYTADCGHPILNSNVSLNYSSTLEDSLLTFQCKDGLFPEDVFTASCYQNGSWIPNPSGHACATSISSAGRQKQCGL